MGTAIYRSGYRIAAALLLLMPAPTLAADSSEEAAPPAESTGNNPHAGNPHGDNPVSGGGFALPGDLRLNGRFDLAYERRNFSKKLANGVDWLQNYHHFLFLTYDRKGSYFGITAEFLDLNFYEIFFRYQIKPINLRLLTKAGKILVPFGGNPLFHQYYGGFTGFDQRLLPVIWGAYGATVNLGYRIEPLGIDLSNDVYIVQGYGFNTPDQVINLQADFSSSTDVRFGWGDRLGVSFGPANLFYSLYYNKLGFRRHLFMQALDLFIYGPPFPVLRDFQFAMGVVRADVAGGRPGIGGVGLDYYHFADYAALRYYPFNWLYVQLRAGLRTMNNRRGTYYDSTRADENDQSTYNLGVWARHHGLSGGLTYYRVTEKKNEQPNDFIRLVVTYEF